MEKKKIFRIYTRCMENGYRQEIPTNITFNCSLEAEKCVNYLKASIKPCIYTDTDGYIYDYFAREDKTKLFESFEDYLKSKDSSQLE
jgi:hypothetical protein